MSNRRLIATALAGCAMSLAVLGGPAARAETAPADTKSVTAPKPASEEKPTSNGTPSTQAKPGGEKKFTKSQLEAFLSKCSQEADEKGLTKAKNKMAERKAYRRQCMSKFGIEPKLAE